MADLLDTGPPARRRRSDARRSVDAILNAAQAVLSERPDATMEEIAAAAGVSRQTVYAHFSSRDILIAALIEVARTQGLAAIDAAHFDTVAPAAALGLFLDISWQLLRRYPVLFDPALNRSPRIDGSDPHLAVSTTLERLIRRGQQSGDFDNTLPASWLVVAILDLGHTAAQQVGLGQLTTTQAPPLLLATALRLCGATAQEGL